MRRYNLIMVLDPSEQHILMCHRQSDPYKGKYNLVGGKIDDGEVIINSAYRELFEETGITRDEITLYPYLDFLWHPIKMSMNVFIGRLKHSVTLVEEVHPLTWVSINENFFDSDLYAGEGNIGHMVQIYHEIRGEIFDN
ncbi:NUDIX hydrolase [Candidatus Xianfuyuplasma coldseepsis]|uniref:NUDIX domain-containing protein n=1 Tax=Candidatus Xianfuyuplasma coldseepsis TaxID=2782163 RepID=A0A7L7KRM7_9MOLU|nr:NUDIX domain-containing protein [Xianfuyuplasma coldseepsis]QMS84604.1 NUDIX domain-containing protein [Xianfuyuplasma coldseepsis]